MQDVSAKISETRDIYNRTGEQYDRDTDAFNTKVAYPHLIETLRQAGLSLAGSRILDVGSGSGRLVVAFTAVGAHALGIELSPESVMRAHAANRLVICGSVLELPSTPSVYDAVVSYHMFSYVPPEAQPRALQEQHRVLVPGGLLLMGVFPCPPAPTEPITITQYGETFTLHVHTEDELRTLLEDAGFSKISFEHRFCTEKEREYAAESVRHILTPERPYVTYVRARA